VFFVFGLRSVCRLLHLVVRSMLCLSFVFGHALLLRYCYSFVRLKDNVWIVMSGSSDSARRLAVKVFYLWTAP